MSYNKRIPLKKAQNWAARLVEILRPHCDRVEVAGSIRREMPDCGDIDIVCIPKHDFDLMGNPDKPCGGFISAVNQFDKLIGNPDGKYTQRQLPEDVKLDLYMADPDNFGLLLAIRTGSADFNVKTLVRGIERINHKMTEGHIYDFSNNVLNPVHVPIREEVDLFNLIGIPFIEPKMR